MRLECRLNYAVLFCRQKIIADYDSLSGDAHDFCIVIMADMKQTCCKHAANMKQTCCKYAAKIGAARQKGK